MSYGSCNFCAVFFYKKKATYLSPVREYVHQQQASHPQIRDMRRGERHIYLQYGIATDSVVSIHASASTSAALIIA